MITLSNLSKKYPLAEVAVLRKIDFEVGAGDFVSIVGRSGSGKTTLLNLIGGIDSHFDGCVTVDGLDLGTLSDEQISEFRSRTIGFVFQSDNLLDHLNCRENVAIASLFSRSGKKPDHRAIADRADQLLRDVGLEGSGKRRSTTLSGGERQRVALARALFNRPKLLLCDEPTGNLDAGTASDLVVLLSELHRLHTMTVVAVTHDEAISGAGHRVVELDDGQLHETGGGTA